MTRERVGCKRCSELTLRVRPFRWTTRHRFTNSALTGGGVSRVRCADPPRKFCAAVRNSAGDEHLAIRQKCDRKTRALRLHGRGLAPAPRYRIEKNRRRQVGSLVPFARISPDEKYSAAIRFGRINSVWMKLADNRPIDDTRIA